MDIVYIFQHSKHDDFELRHSLRSVAKNCPWVSKVWVYGDKPNFISDDKSKIEHVHGGKGSMFKLLYEASHVNGLSDEFYMLADDYIVLREFVPGTVYYLNSLDEEYENHFGLMNKWHQQLWNTWLHMKHNSFSERLNYEAHVPTYFKKEWIRAAYDPALVGDEACDGLMGITYILNHARPKRIACINNDRICFISADVAELDVKHKTFMMYDDAALGIGLEAGIKKLFPLPCKYEKVA